jgi:uncharacterized protein (TIGR02598 family)
MKRANKGFTLIEVSLSLAVATFCLMSVFGLVPIGVTSNQNAAQQTTAAGIATALCSDIHGTPVVGGTSASFLVAVPAAGSSSRQTIFFDKSGSRTGGAGVTQAPANARYRATVTFAAEDTTSSTSPRSKTFQVGVQITWPALADPAAANTAVNFAGAMETPIALNCN